MSSDRTLDPERTANIQALLALRSQNLEHLSYLLAVNAFLKRGLPRLQIIAPVGWHRNCFNQTGGGFSSFRVHTRSNDEYILAVAFEGDARHVERGGGYVKSYVVRNHFDITEGDMKFWGLDNSWPFPKRNPGIIIVTDIVDKAIEAVLRCPPDFFRQPRYYSSVQEIPTQAELLRGLAHHRRYPQIYVWKREYLPT